jgi:hypothetical protein
MDRKRLVKASVLIAAACGLLLAWRLTSEAVPVSAEDGQRTSAAPALVLACRERDFGTLPQGMVLRTLFRVENGGDRRLILVDKTAACCGEEPDPRGFIVPPHEAKELPVEVDTMQWWGHMEHVVEYTTNDPATPRFTLKLTARVTTAPSP